MDAALPVPKSPYGPLHSVLLPLYGLVINGRCPEALELADALEPGIRAFGDLRVLAFLLHLRMYALAGVSRLHEAAATGEQLLALHRADGSHLGQAKVHADLAEFRIRLGRLDDGIRDLARSLALLEGADRRHRRYAAAMSSVLEAAKAAELYELADRAARVCVEGGVLTGTDRVAAELQHAELLLEWGIRLEHLGESADVVTPHFRRAVRLTRSVLDQTTGGVVTAEAPLAPALLALALAKVGESATAAEIAVQLLVPTRTAGQVHEARLAHLAYGIALRDSGDLAAARRELIAARDLADPFDTRSGQLLYEYELANLAVRRYPEAAADVLSALRGHAQRLWRARLERISLLHQERARADLETARDRADEDAARDPLTGLGNRRRFEQEMSVLAGLGDLHPPVCLALIDVDGFKSVNDGHSHAVGDEVLRHIAGILRSSCRKQDVPVRFGGDEFAIFFQADVRTAGQVAERIRLAVADTSWNDLAEGLAVTLSVGIAQLQSRMSVEELFAEADRRLYVAKQGGRNRLTAA